MDERAEDGGREVYGTTERFPVEGEVPSPEGRSHPLSRRGGLLRDRRLCDRVPIGWNDALFRIIPEGGVANGVVAPGPTLDPQHRVRRFLGYAGREVRGELSPHSVILFSSVL